MLSQLFVFLYSKQHINSSHAIALFISPTLKLSISIIKQWRWKSCGDGCYFDVRWSWATSRFMPYHICCRGCDMQQCWGCFQAAFCLTLCHLSFHWMCWRFLLYYHSICWSGKCYIAVIRKLEESAGSDLVFLPSFRGLAGSLWYIICLKKLSAFRKKPIMAP